MDLIANTILYFHLSLSDLLLTEIYGKIKCTFSAIIINLVAMNCTECTSHKLETIINYFNTFLQNNLTQCIFIQKKNFTNETLKNSSTGLEMLI